MVVYVVTGFYKGENQNFDSCDIILAFLMLKYQNNFFNYLDYTMVNIVYSIPVQKVNVFSIVSCFMIPFITLIRLKK